MCLSCPALVSIVGLPGELHNRIISYLNTIDCIALKLTSVHFNNLIPKLSSEELHETEASIFAQSKDLYGCYDWLRLRPRGRIADNQLKRKELLLNCEEIRGRCWEKPLGGRALRIIWPFGRSK